MSDWPDAVIIIGSIVAAIMLLTLFFKIINWIGRKFEKSPTRIAFKGILNEKTPATVHLATGTTFENVRLMGFTDTTSSKGHLPFELNNMVILEHADGRRTIIQAKSIRMIDVDPQAK